MRKPDKEYKIDPKAKAKLHSKQHVLADDLSKMLGEPKKFAAYLGLAMKYPESVLRRIAAEVMEDYHKDTEGKLHRGKLFFYKVGQLKEIKKEHDKT